MFHYHFLKERQHADFLSENRIDPITGDKIQEGDCIVICAACKSAFLEDSWNYLRQQHCDQYGTLNKIPKTEKIHFNEEPLIFFPFDVRENDSFSDEFMYRFLQNSTSALMAFLPLILIVFAWIIVPSFGSDGFQMIFNIFIMPLGVVVFYSVANTLSSKPTTILGNIMMRKNHYFIKNVRQNYAKENYLAIHIKNENIVSKTKLGEKTIPFSNVQKFVYSYYPDRMMKKHGYLVLQVSVTTKKNDVIEYESIFREEDAPKLKSFLKRLPQDLKVFSRRKQISR
ncbi:hypothetical protein WAF17_04860 [Bernardetia sp. ABR2-2B]|uniref:hypothetical protein n=1 Tax=Bernardetia sp. ABR2-2B TaxID=3127472 RepID=UPI0030CF3BA7